MSEAVLKAFVLCDEITDSPGGAVRKDLRGAGLAMIPVTTPLPIKRTFWVYLELTDQKPSGNLQLAIMRADSGRRLFFRVIAVQFPQPLQTTLVADRKRPRLNS